MERACVELIIYTDGIISSLQSIRINDRKTEYNYYRSVSLSYMAV